MIGETAVVGIVNAWLTSRKIDKWARLLLSCGASAFCTGGSIAGAGIIAHISAGQCPGIAITLGFAEGMIASAAIVFNIWRRSPLTKGMPITVPRSLEQAEQVILQSEGMVTHENKG